MTTLQLYSEMSIGTDSLDYCQRILRDILRADSATWNSAIQVTMCYICCLLGTSGTAEFEITQIRGRRRYPIYVNATSTDGQLTYLEREVRRGKCIISVTLHVGLLFI